MINTQKQSQMSYKTTQKKRPKTMRKTQKKTFENHLKNSQKAVANVEQNHTKKKRLPKAVKTSRQKKRIQMMSAAAVILEFLEKQHQIFSKSY